MHSQVQAPITKNRSMLATNANTLCTNRPHPLSAMSMFYELFETLVSNHLNATSAANGVRAHRRASWCKKKLKESCKCDRGAGGRMHT